MIQSIISPLKSYLVSQSVPKTIPVSTPWIFPHTFNWRSPAVSPIHQLFFQRSHSINCLKRCISHNLFSSPNTHHKCLYTSYVLPLSDHLQLFVPHHVPSSINQFLPISIWFFPPVVKHSITFIKVLSPSIMWKLGAIGISPQLSRYFTHNLMSSNPIIDWMNFEGSAVVPLCQKGFTPYFGFTYFSFQLHCPFIADLIGLKPPFLSTLPSTILFLLHIMKLLLSSLFPTHQIAFGIFD